MQVFNRALAFETADRPFYFVPVGVDGASPTPAAAAAVPEAPRGEPKSAKIQKRSQAAAVKLSETAKLRRAVQQNARVMQQMQQTLNTQQQMLMQCVRIVDSSAKHASWSEDAPASALRVGPSKYASPSYQDAPRTSRLSFKADVLVAEYCPAEYEVRPERRNQPLAREAVSEAVDLPYVLPL